MAHPSSVYAERLTVPWWAWPAALGGSAVLAAQLTIGAIELRHPLTYLTAFLLASLALLALSRIRIAVVGPDGDRAGELRVDDARLPLDVIAEVEVIGLDQRRDLLGVDADPLAFVIQRPWVAGGVRVDLNDPADPTPYWYLSSRHPDQLAAAIRRMRDGAPATP